jgi:hypothetical protein
MVECPGAVPQVVKIKWFPGGSPEWHGIKGIFVDFTGLDHHAVKITKHKNPLYSDQYEPHGRKQSFLHPWYFNDILLNPVPFRSVLGSAHF